MNRPCFLRSDAILGLAALAAAASCASAAFPPPIQANPAAEYTAEIPIDYQNVVSHTRIIGYDPIFNPQPRVYWFKYTSNGRTALKLDTLGSDFGTSGQGGVLGSYNQSQIAVYTASGQPVAVSKGTRNLAGDPIPVYPTYSTNSNLWYVPQGLSETYLGNGLQYRNPHWDVDPDDPTPFTAWAAPGNEGNSQKYFPPHYPIALNEYHVWSTALSTVILDQDGNPVINPSTGQPRPQPGWRYYDRARHGPGTPWNRFKQLPAGEYYFAVASADPVFAGDQYVEEVLRFPVHYDYSTQTPNQPILTAPMGAFQYYLAPVTATNVAYGNLQFNVTQTPSAANLVWSGGLAGGAWDVQTTLNWKNGAIDDRFFQNDNVIFDDTGLTGTVVLSAAALAPGTITISAGTLNYTFTGAGSITGAATLEKTGAAQLTIANSGVNNYTGATRVLGGTLELATTSTIGGGLLQVGPAGKVRLSPGRTAAVKIAALEVAAPGSLDVANNKLAIDYTGDTPLHTVRSMLQSGYAGGAWTGGGIVSSNADAGSFGVGFSEAAAVFTNFPATFGGQSVGATTILIAWTRFGDANLDGVTGIADFARLAAGYNQPGAWENGDFNYDGTVGIGDFSLLAANYNQSAPSARGGAVPEPAFGVLGLAAWALARRRGSMR